MLPYLLKRLGVAVLVADVDADQVRRVRAQIPALRNRRL